MPSTTSNSPTVDTGAAQVLRDVASGWPMLSPSKALKTPALMVDGRPRSIRFIYRSFEQGNRGADGQRHRLGYAIGPGGGRYTTEPAIHRWLAKLNGQTATPEFEVSRAHAKADARLVALGL